MTAQDTGTAIYEGEGYGLIGVSGRDLFESQGHRMEPIGRSAACYRGFLCRYRSPSKAGIHCSNRVQASGPLGAGTGAGRPMLVRGTDVRCP